MSIVKGEYKMRKYIKYILITMMLFIPTVNAEECTYKDRANINAIAKEVKAQYQIKTGILDPNTYLEDVSDIKYDYLETSVYNLSEELYLIIKNDINDSQITVNYFDTTDGTYSFRWDNEDEIVTYSIEIYSSNLTNCPDEKLKVLSLKIPKRNPYANMALCSGAENLNLCAEYISFNEPTVDALISQIEAYKKGEIDEDANQTQEEQKTFIDILKDNKVIVISASIFVVLLMVMVILVILKKNKKRRKSHGRF